MAPAVDTPPDRRAAEALGACQARSLEQVEPFLDFDLDGNSLLDLEEFTEPQADLHFSCGSSCRRLGGTCTDKMLTQVSPCLWWTRMQTRANSKAGLILKHSMPGP